MRKRDGESFITDVRQPYIRAQSEVALQFTDILSDYLAGRFTDILHFGTVNRSPDDRHGVWTLPPPILSTQLVHECEVIATMAAAAFENRSEHALMSLIVHRLNLITCKSKSHGML